MVAMGTVVVGRRYDGVRGERGILRILEELAMGLQYPPGNDLLETSAGNGSSILSSNAEKSRWGSRGDLGLILYFRVGAEAIALCLPIMLKNIRRSSKANRFQILDIDGHSLRALRKATVGG